MVALAELGGRLLAYLRAANNGRTLQGKGHDGAVIGHIEGQSGMGLERYIVVIERQMGALETLVALERAGEHPQTAALKGYRGYLIVVNTVVRRGRHLVFAWHVEPHLKAQQALVGSQILGVKGARAGRKPLRFAIAHGLFIA